MAASFDPVLLHTVADAIATEARAKNREYTEGPQRRHDNYTGLSFWSPNINIFATRAGQRTGDLRRRPFFDGEAGRGLHPGIAGRRSEILQALACAKHFAVHSGPEIERHSFDAEPSRGIYTKLICRNSRQPSAKGTWAR